jgi:AraC family transcriptional regulator
MSGNTQYFDRRSFAGYEAGHRRFVDLAVTETVYRPDQQIPHHSHDRSYISVVVRGSYTEQCEATSLDVLPGHVILHIAGESHSNHFHKTGGRLLNLELSPAFWARLDIVKPTSRRILRSSYALQLGLKLQKELSSSDPASSWAMEGLMMELVAETFRDRIPKVKADRCAWLDAVMELLKDRYSEPITLNEIASFASVHPVHLARAFRKRYLCSVGDYIRKLRIEAACRELRSDVSIAEIALHTGFADQSHLCRVLKQHTGMSPRQFREHLGQHGKVPND